MKLHAKLILGLDSQPVHIYHTGLQINKYSNNIVIMPYLYHYLKSKTINKIHVMKSATIQKLTAVGLNKKYYNKIIINR